MRDSGWFEPGKFDEELLRPEAMKIDRDLLIVTLAFYPANSADTELDVTDLQADTQPFCGIRNNPDIVIFDKRVFVGEIRIDPVEQ